MPLTRPTDADYKPVQSSRCRSIAWVGGNLWVVFKDGAEGYYADVPEVVFYSMMAARSKGIFLNESVIGQYTWTRVGSR